MADALTSTASLDFDQGMWDLAVHWALRPELYFDRFAEVQSIDSAPKRGTTVTFTTMNDMTAAVTPLSETVDVDAVALSDTSITLTLAEYGNAALPTWRVRATSFVALDPVVANAIGFNAGLSQDTLARTVMQAGTNVRYATGGAVDPTSRTTVDTDDKITAHDVRRIRADLVNAFVQTFNGYYAAVIHPDVAIDLREETGAGAWRVPREYVDPANIYNGETGLFENFRFMESPRAPVFVNASNNAGAAGNIDVYRTLFFGREAIAKAYSTYDGRGPQPIVILSPVVDKLRRFQPLGWHWYGVYGVFRQAALWGLESTSSIANNAS